MLAGAILLVFSGWSSFLAIFTQDSVSSQWFEKLGVFSLAEWDAAQFIAGQFN